MANSATTFPPPPRRHHAATSKRVKTLVGKFLRERDLHEEWSYVGKCKAHLRHLPETQDVTINHRGARMSISASALQRRLEGLGLCFRNLVTQVRLEIVSEEVKNGGVSVGSMRRLDFSRANTMSRFLKQHEGDIASFNRSNADVWFARRRGNLSWSDPGHPLLRRRTGAQVNQFEHLQSRNFLLREALLLAEEHGVDQQDILLRLDRKRASTWNIGGVLPADASMDAIELAADLDDRADVGLELGTRTDERILASIVLFLAHTVAKLLNMSMRSIQRGTTFTDLRREADIRYRSGSATQLR